MSELRKIVEAFIAGEEPEFVKQLDNKVVFLVGYDNTVISYSINGVPNSYTVTHYADATPFSWLNAVIARISTLYSSRYIYDQTIARHVVNGTWFNIKFDLDLAEVV